MQWMMVATQAEILFCFFCKLLFATIAVRTFLVVLHATVPSRYTAPPPQELAKWRLKKFAKILTKRRQRANGGCCSCCHFAGEKVL